MNCDENLHFTKEQVETFKEEQTEFIWGYDNADRAYKYTPDRYIEEYLLRHYGKEVKYSVITYNDSISPTGGIINTIPATFPEAKYVEYYAPAPENNDLSWQALRFVFEKRNKNWYLLAIVRDVYSP
jgi:hypothetical protein